MSKLVQPFVIILLSVLSLFLGVKLYLCTHKQPHHAYSPIQMDSSVTAVAPSVMYKDSQGVQHMIIDADMHSIIEKEASRQAEELAPVIEQVAENLGIKPSQVEGSTTISSSAARDSVAFLKRQLESARRLSFYYKDKYLTLKVNTNPLDSTDLGDFSYKYNADLNITQYNKRNWFLGAKHSYLDISSNDPNTTIMGVNRFTVKQKEPDYGLRLGVTGGYGRNTNSFSFGPFARFDVAPLKGSFRASYLYNTKTQTTGFSISFDKDFIRF